VKDLKIYYEFERPFEGINLDFERELEKLAEKQGLKFQSSGVVIGKGIRDIHYRKENKPGR